MAGAGARTRKDGSASAKVGSVERLKPRQIGPAVPTLGQLKAMNSAAAGARGAERRSLEARAESARAARSAHLTARGGERRTLAAAEAGAPRLNMANALGVTAEHHYTALSSQRANWYAERMKVTDPIKRATITGLIKQYDAAMPGAHAAMVAEAAAKAAKPREPGLEHFVAQRVAAKAREAERGESPRRIAAEQAKAIRETSATLASGRPVLVAAQAAHAEHVAAGAAIKAMRNDAPAAEKRAAVARWNAAKAGLAEHGRRVDAELAKGGKAIKPTDQQAKDIAFLAARAKRHGIAFEHKDGNFHVEGRFGMQSHPLASQAKATMRNRIKQKIAGIRGERGRERSAAAAKAAEAKAVADKAQLQHNHVARQAEAARTGHVIVRTRTGEQTVKTLETHGPVVVHPTLEAPGFTVTHARSGLAVGQSETREGAVAAAQRLASPAIAKHLDAATQGDRRATSIVKRMMAKAKRAEGDAALKEKLGPAMAKVVKASQARRVGLTAEQVRDSVAAGYKPTQARP